MVVMANPFPEAWPLIILAELPGECGVRCAASAEVQSSGNPGCQDSYDQVLMHEEYKG